MTDYHAPYSNVNVTDSRYTVLGKISPNRSIMVLELSLNGHELTVFKNSALSPQHSALVPTTWDRLNP